MAGNHVRSVVPGNRRRLVCGDAWPRGRDLAPGENRMTLIQALGNVAVALAAYLLYALIKAEKF
jgi:K+-transporting ATPase KdpF subunit